MEIRATTILRHNKLIERRELLGLSQAKAANLCGLGIDQYARFERLNFPEMPQYRHHLVKISNGMDLTENEVMPEELAGIQIDSRRTSIKEVEVKLMLESRDSQKRLIMASPDEILAEKEEKEALLAQIESSIGHLPTTRQRNVFSMYYGMRGHKKHSAIEIAEVLNTTANSINACLRGCEQKLQKVNRIMEMTKC